MASTVLPNGIIIPEKFSRDWYADLYHNWQELDNLLGGGGANDGTLTIQKNGATVGTFSANQATDETIDITVPDVNDATLTIQKNGTDVATFSANSSTNATANITVPTKTSDLTNDSGFITSDNTKIPLAGSNQISGSLIPARDNTVSLGSYDYNFQYVNAKRIRQNATSDYLFLIGASSWNEGASLGLFGKDSTTLSGGFRLDVHNGTEFRRLQGSPNGTLSWGNKNVAMREDTIPRSGGAIMEGPGLYKARDDSQFEIGGGASWGSGATMLLAGKDYSYSGANGRIYFQSSDGTNNGDMLLYPSGTWTWSGTAVQLVSDQRYKQQITEIDDKLLDAWEDVNLVQFKYNDAVDQKGKDKARLHTGYVVQQIDSACKSHGVDVSAYGLYCHEEYPQETEEVEVEQADGTKVKETRVIREASEHYSLRYTEVYAVECMYLRRCIKQLTARIEELEKGNNTK